MKALALAINRFQCVVHDLRYAIRNLRLSPGFTGLIILMLALGMGANFTVFRVTDALLLRMLPVKDPATLFRTVRASGNANDSAGDSTSYSLYRDMQKRTSHLAELMAYQTASPAAIAIEGPDPQRLIQQTVSGNYFRVLGVSPVAGRLISMEDETARHAVAVISYRLWKSKFDGNEHAIGSELHFDNHEFDIIGVSPAQFFGVEVGKVVDVWTPLSATRADNHRSGLRIMGRLKPGVTIAQATAPMQAAMNELMLEDVREHAPPGTPKQIINRFLAGMRIKGVPSGGGISYLRQQYQLPLWIMMLIVGLVLVTASSNVANLLLAKASARQREIAIRRAIGAGKGRILQQHIIESLLLAILAAGAGVLLAHWGTPLLVRLLAPSAEPVKLITGMDLRFLGFTSILSTLTVLICGLLPGLRIADIDLYAALKNGTQFTGISGRLAPKVLVGSQVALSLVLVVGAVLFTRTLVSLVSSHLGFNPAQVFVTQIGFRYPSDKENFIRAWSDFLGKVREFPGVKKGSLSSAGLFRGEPQLMGIRTTAAKYLPPDPTSGLLFVSSDYFQTLGIPFIAGRDFEFQDQNSSASMRAIVNEAFVHKFIGSENPLGRRLTKLANAPAWAEIVGVVKDAKYGSLRENPPPMIYVPYGRIGDWIPPQGHPGASMFLQVRGELSAALLTAYLHHHIGQQFTFGEVFRQQQAIDDTLVRERLLATVASLFGGLALALAALGLYGILNYSVVRRRQELGIRVALGAEPAAILGLVLRESGIIVTVGILVGLLAAEFTTHLARALLFGFAPNDSMTFIVAVSVMLMVSFGAAFIPAYRATQMHPLIALRHE